MSRLKRVEAERTMKHPRGYPPQYRTNVEKNGGLKILTAGVPDFPSEMGMRHNSAPPARNLLANGRPWLEEDQPLNSYEYGRARPYICNDQSMVDNPFFQNTPVCRYSPQNMPPKMGAHYQPYETIHQNALVGALRPRPPHKVTIHDFMDFDGNQSAPGPKVDSRGSPIFRQQVMPQKKYLSARIRPASTPNTKYTEVQWWSEQ